jgi:hypothetical protein
LILLRRKKKTVVTKEIAELYKTANKKVKTKEILM